MGVKKETILVVKSTTIKQLQSLSSEVGRHYS